MSDAETVDAYKLADPDTMSPEAIVETVTTHEVVCRRLLDPPSRGETHEFGVDEWFAFRGGVGGATLVSTEAKDVLKAAHGEEQSTLVWVPLEDSDRFGGENG